MTRIFLVCKRKLLQESNYYKDDVCINLKFPCKLDNNKNLNNQ